MRNTSDVPGFTCGIDTDSDVPRSTSGIDADSGVSLFSCVCFGILIENGAVTTMFSNGAFTVTVSRFVAGGVSSFGVSMFIAESSPVRSISIFSVFIILFVMNLSFVP